MEIVITLEMVKAGARTYARADERVQSDEEIVSEIYRAMRALEPAEQPFGSLGSGGNEPLIKPLDLPFKRY